MKSTLFLACLALVEIAAAETPPPVRDTWQAVAIQGQRVGYGHLTEVHVPQGDQTLIRTDIHLHTVMKRFNGKLTIIIDQQTEEDASGNLRSFHFRLDNPPASRIEMTGRVTNGVLQLQTTSGGQTTPSELPAPADLKSPVYVDRLLEATPLAPGESRTLSLFDPQLAAIVSVRATSRGPATFQLPNGQSQPGTHVAVEYLSGIPGLTIDCYLDAAGKMVLNESKLLGTSTWNVSREQALEEIPADIDLGLTALIKVDRITDSHRLREAVYRLALPDSLPAVLLQANSDTQTVRTLDERTVELTVKSLRPVAAAGSAVAPPPAAAGSAVAPPDAKYLAATTMARSDDPEIVKLAAAAPADAAPAEVAVALEQTVHKWLTRKNMSSSLASASEVVRSKEGDCTEHAVLLTALLRARRIPARVVVGLVYWDQFTAFAGHAWTEAWLDGRWIPLDATQADGGIGADHIRLGDSSLADGDAGLITAGIAAWQLLDKAQLTLERAER